MEDRINKAQKIISNLPVTLQEKKKLRQRLDTFVSENSDQLVHFLDQVDLLLSWTEAMKAEAMLDQLENTQQSENEIKEQVMKVVQEEKQKNEQDRLGKMRDLLNEHN